MQEHVAKLSHLLESAEGTMRDCDAAPDSEKYLTKSDRIERYALCSGRQTNTPDYGKDSA